MGRFRDLPVKHKLTLIIMASSSVALVLACTAFLILESVRFRASVVAKLTALAEVVASNSAAAMIFADAHSAKETLDALRTEAHLVAAALYTSGGRLFASYLRRDALLPLPVELRPDGHYFAVDRLELYRAITFDGKRIGTVYLHFDLEEMHSRFQQYWGILLVSALGAFLAALMVSARLQGAVSKPILSLAHAAKVVSSERDYSVRAAPGNRDEIGILIDAFNEMLGEIQKRDAELERARAELEQRVEARTRELQQEVAERRRVAVALEKALRVKSEFLNVVSHELRTPLNVIMGFARIVEDQTLGPIDEPQRSALRKVLRAGDELAGMIDDLVEATRIETERVRVEPHAVDLVEFMGHLRTAYENQNPKGLQLRWEWPEKLPLIQTDAAKLRKILHCLIHNALKFTEKGEVRISVRPRRNGGSPRVEFRVEDTGIGISPDKLPLIFNMFQQADGSATRSYGGMGLGLYIAKSLTRLLGGELTVQSEPGKGSTFTLTIPQARGEREEKAA